MAVRFDCRGDLERLGRAVDDGGHIWMVRHCRQGIERSWVCFRFRIRGVLWECQSSSGVKGLYAYHEVDRDSTENFIKSMGL